MSQNPHRLALPQVSVFSKSLPGWMTLLLAFSLCLYLCSGHAAAQEKAEPGTEKKADEEEVQIPKPKEIDLQTDDGLQLKATYFPGVKGPESIPVIIVHGLDNKNSKHSRKDFDGEGALAATLQEKLGCAVIVPDLRYHGDSLKRKLNNRKAEDLKGKRMPPAEIANMVTQDLLAVKEFLWQENNQKKLNLNKLSVIGVDEGAALALKYAAFDSVGYDKGAAKIGPLQLGKFVKSLVLVSPVPNVPILKIPQVLRMEAVIKDLPVMIILGNKSKDYLKDAEILNNIFLKPRPPADDNKPESRTVWFFKKIETPLQGPKLLAEPTLKVPEKIVSFLSVWVVKNPDAVDWGWKQLKLPYE